jgi:hypothetical protein
MVVFFRRGALAFTATTLCLFAFGASTAIPDVAVQNVTLSCSDGTNLGLTLGAAEATGLTNAVTAMGLYPAGLSCGVSTQADPPPGGNPKTDYAVGGGDQFAFPAPTAACRQNFGFSAHTPSGIPLLAKGTFNDTVPGGCAGLGNTGELRVNINCVDVDGNHADMRGTVTKATGQFATSGSDFAASGQAFISTTDDGPFGDTLGVSPTSSASTSACGAATHEDLIMSGNITVHDASQ